jgi:hypothetical protein
MRRLASAVGKLPYKLNPMPALKHAPLVVLAVFVDSIGREVLAMVHQQMNSTAASSAGSERIAAHQEPMLAGSFEYVAVAFGAWELLLWAASITLRSVMSFLAAISAIRCSLRVMS